MDAMLMDRRVRKTKKLLKESLVELLKKKSVSDISVRELTDMADVGRGTFYLHYKSVPDLFERLKEDLQEELAEGLERLDAEEPGRRPERMFQEFYVLVYKNMDLLLVLLEGKGGLELIDRLEQTLREKYSSVWTQEEAGTAGFFDFLAYGLTGLSRRWIQGGLKETPEQMAKITERILSCGSKFLKEAAGKTEGTA